MSVMAYKIAVLVYVFNDQRKTLLLRRKKFPNKDLYSPIGGKLEQGTGESPYGCALREIEEEIGVALTLEDIHLLGIVSEKGYANGAAGGAAAGSNPSSHWLMFCFEVMRPLNFAGREMEEGVLEWLDPIIVEKLEIPKTDVEVIWPLVREYSTMLNAGRRRHESFFSVHIDCTDAEQFVVTQEHPRGR